MTLWLLFVPLMLVALLFVVWRLKFPVSTSRADDSDLEANRILYREKLAQLQQQRDNGEIDRDQYHALELEHQRQFLADNAATGRDGRNRGGAWLVAGAALLVPVLAVILYQQLGASTEMQLRTLLEQRSALVTAGEVDGEQLNRMTRQVIRTAEDLAESRPDNPAYPVLLARLHADQGNLEKAIPWYVRATVLLPEHGDILAEYAQVLFFAAGNQMSEQIRELTFRALELSPRNQTALSLAGIATFHQGEYQRAIDYWNRALAELPRGAPSGEALRSGIVAARERLGVASTPSAEPVEGASLRLQVSLGENVEVPGDTTVFVYAREWQGAPMPLAIAKLQVSDLPREIVLTEAMAMTPAMSLATVPQVEVVARVSMTGAPTPSPGDYQATKGPIEVGKQEKPVVLPIITRITE